MANTDPDDVALLKKELAQFLLTEIASVEGGTAFRREVGDQVGVAIDRILAERLKPTLENLERRAAEHARSTDATLEDALLRLKAAAPAGDAVAAEQKLSDIAARLDDLRQRIARVEETARPQRGPVATAQPLQAAGRSEAKLADERLAAATTTASTTPRWVVLLLLLLTALSVLGLGNLYYEKLVTPAVAPSSMVSPPVSATPSTATPSPASTVPPTHADDHAAPAPGQVPVSVPPQNPAAIPSVTPKPAPSDAAPVTPPQPRANIPADFAIERGWLAAQPFAVEPRLAHRIGSTDAYPTLKSIVCGRSPNCASDALMSDSAGGKQLIALQMLMSQIGDRFCTPRRAVAVTGLVSADGLADLAAIAKCAGGAPATCVETQTRVCAPDADSLQSGSQAARAALLRWALWKTGST